MTSRNTLSPRSTGRAILLGAAALLVAGAAITANGTASAADKPAGPVGAADKAPMTTVSSAPYFLATDPVTGEKLPARPVIATIKGREFRFASEANRKTFEAAPDKYLGKVDKAMIEAEKPFYPTKECLVSNEELGSMGEPIDRIVGNRLVRLCCKSCDDRLAKDQAAVIKALDAATVKAQKASYASKSCVVSGEPLGSMGDPIDMVVGGRLVRLCCKGCVDKLNADPVAYLAKLPPAGKKS
jgi:YHS domain-containing protein